MILFLCSAVCTFLADLFTQKKVNDLDAEGRLPQTVLGGRVHLKRVENPGMILGLGKEPPMLVKILPAALAAVYFLISLPRLRRAGAVSRIGWGLFLGGAAGNAVESLIPPVVGRNPEALNGGGVKTQLAGFFPQGHL